MDEISGTERVAEGILLNVKTGSGDRELVFTFKELIDSQVNALHLLQFPQKYLCDPEARVIVRRQQKKLTCSRDDRVGGGISDSFFHRFRVVVLQ